VAKLAEVSLATASKVVNGRPDVSTDTRERVIDALRATGYSSPIKRPGPDPAGRILAVLDGIDTMYSATVLHGIVAGGEAHGVDVVIRFVQRDQGGRSDGRVLSETRAADFLGVVAVSNAIRWMRPADWDDGAPIVAVDPTEQQPAAWMAVGATNWSGAKAATDHLLDLGHRRVAWIGGPSKGGPLAERFHGYRAALEEAGMRQRTQHERHGDFTFDFGRAAAEYLLALPERPTAIMCGNDEIAIGAMHAARAAGLVVPDDLSVVGFDDTTQAAWTTPQLTTVRQPLADMGRMSVSMILAASRGLAPESPHIQLATGLTLRESTGPVPG